MLLLDARLFEYLIVGRAKVLYLIGEFGLLELSVVHLRSLTTSTIPGLLVEAVELMVIHFIKASWLGHIALASLNLRLFLLHLESCALHHTLSILFPILILGFCFLLWGS